jgi:LPXTG-site transpeptidase (sortase) family protein
LTTIEVGREPSVVADSITTDTKPEEGSGPTSIVLAPRPPLGRRIQRWTVVTGVGLLLAVLGWWLFVDPIAHLWYQSRQQQLAAQGGSVLAPKVGQQVAVLQNVQTGLNVVVAQGDSSSVLRGGPGHQPGTPLPGHRGNSVIFGHAAHWGGPFRDLHSLAVGSPIYVKTRSGQVYKYLVTASQSVSGTDRRLLAPSTDFRLTLVTTTGGIFSGGHLVVTAISGPKGRLQGPTSTTRASPDIESRIVNANVGGFFLRGGAAVGVVWLVRRRHRLRVALLVSSPVVLSALLSLCLALDLVLNPLA